MEAENELNALADLEAPDLQHPVLDEVAVGAAVAVGIPAGAHNLGAAAMLHALGAPGPVLPQQHALGAPGPVLGQPGVGGPVPFVVQVDRPYEDGAFELFPRVVPTWAAPRMAVSWTPRPESDISPDDQKNRFQVRFYISGEGDNVHETILPVCGRYTIEDLCAGLVYKLRRSNILALHQTVSAVFRTIQETPLLIPSGTRVAELYKTHMNETGGGVDLSCSIYAYEEGRRFLICPHSDIDFAALLPI